MKEDPNYVETHDSRMIRKFGSKEQFELVKRSHGLIPRGAEVGLDASCGYTEENLSKRLQSSTLRSQRLVYFVAKRYGWEKCEELYGVLNRRHFIESGVLNDIGLLLDSCDEVGLNREMCENFLISNEYEKEVLQLYEDVLDRGIHSIPTTIIDGQYILNGAVRADEILDVFNRLLRENSFSGSCAFTF